MFRNGLLATVVAAGLALPATAGELDRDRPAPTGDVLGTAVARTGGTEMDRESPTQAGFWRGPGFVNVNVGYGGFYGGYRSFYGGGWGGYPVYGGFTPVYRPAFYGGGFGYPAYYGGYRSLN